MLVIYDCGHVGHAEYVENFLQVNSSISSVYIVVSHNDGDHTDGVPHLLCWLQGKSQYADSVGIYTHQYLKHLDEILEKIDDGRRNRESLKASLLSEFDNIATIIETAKTVGIPAYEALYGTSVGNCVIAGPTIDEFTDVAAKAVDSREDDSIGEGDERETVMNAASVQLKCILDNDKEIILSGDASPAYLHNLDSYDIIQLPHHGQLSDAESIIETLGGNAYAKEYLISDNTGNTNAGSDNLMEFLAEERFDLSLVHNTKEQEVCLPIAHTPTIHISPSRPVKLG
jgi:hypothetical protein